MIEGIIQNYNIKNNYLEKFVQKSYNKFQTFYKNSIVVIKCLIPPLNVSNQFTHSHPSKWEIIETV